MMRLLEPLWLLVFLPFGALAVWSWSRVAGMSRGRRMTSLVVRLVVYALVAVALAGPQCVRRNSGLATIVVLDRSHSVSDADRSRADQMVKDLNSKLGPDDVAGVVAVGAEAALETVPTGRRTASASKVKVDGSGTNLAAGVRLASAIMPEGKAKRILLLTDGNETTGDLYQAAQAASVDNIQIDHFALGATDDRTEASIKELRIPNEKRADEPFEVRVAVESTVGQDSTLVLDRDGVEVARQRVRLSPGQTTIAIGQRLTDPGFYRYRATLLATRDLDNRNNVGSGFTTVRGKPKILVLQGSSKHTQLADALRAQGLDVDLFGPEGASVRPEDVQRYDAVFLNDINAALLAPQQIDMLAAAARETGVGLAMVGGEDSFLPGGWYGTSVIDVLPVGLDVRQRKTFPSTSVLIVVDASGSMGAMEDGVQKIQLAAKAATETVNLLSPLDRVGVAGSTDGIEFVAPMQELKDKPATNSKIKKLRPGAGGIYSAPSLRFAKKELEAEKSKVRHFILLADGNDVDDYGDSLQTIRSMREQKITTSVVAIGDGKDVPFLKQVAAVGGGRFYLATKASKLPAIFTQDVALMARSAIEELVFVPELMPGSDILSGIVPSEVPALQAYCLSEAKPLAVVEMASPKKDPILATWQAGLGSTLAFTSDAQNHWASRWVGWDGFSRFWSQAARSIQRRVARNEYQLEARPSGTKGEVALKARDRFGVPLSGDSVELRLLKPDGKAEPVRLVEEAPGEFHGTFVADQIGSYMLTVSESGRPGESGVATSGFSVPYHAEYRTHRTNAPLLASVSEVSGGQAVSDAAQAVRHVPDPGETRRDVWQELLFVALGLFVLDVGVRRVALPMSRLLSVFSRRSVETETRPAHVSTRLKAKLDEIAPETRTTEARPIRIPTNAPPPASPKTASAATKLLEKRRQEQDRRKRP